MFLKTRNEFISIVMKFYVLWIFPVQASNLEPMCPTMSLLMFPTMY